VELCAQVRFSRTRAGSEVEGTTHDVGPGGMRVATRRPLRLDEHLSFVLALDDGTEVCGQAHVVREHACDVYGLCFDRLSPGDRACLETLAAAETG
jgi:hypothetical protein